MINFEELKKTFPKDWLLELKKDYEEMVKKSNVQNINFFLSPATYDKNRQPNEEINDYFENMLYGTNIGVIDYILKNRNKFKNLKFLDYGSGLSILSIFLKKLHIECVNYDDYSQIGEHFHFQENFYNKYKVSAITKLIPENIDVIVTSGIWIYRSDFNNDNIKKIKYFMIDPIYKNEMIKDLSEYKLLHQIDNIIEVYINEKN